MNPVSLARWFHAKYKQHRVLEINIHLDGTMEFSPGTQTSHAQYSKCFHFASKEPLFSWKGLVLEGCLNTLQTEVIDPAVRFKRYLCDASLDWELNNLDCVDLFKILNKSS
jgi:hypothetical protein